MVKWSLMGLLGPSFIRKAKRFNRAVFAWTVNETKEMQWCISHELDGVISDDPKKFLDTCDAYEEQPVTVRWSFREWFALLRFQLLIGAYFFLFRWRVGSGIDKQYLRNSKVEGKKSL
jgi:Glycerophosphoryl diester phosphodiesterase family